MREYYHFYYTCPNCHEPFIVGGPLEKRDDEIKCLVCKTVFKDYIDIRPYTKLCRDLLEKNQNEKRFSRLPLLWKVSMNIIEETYVDWIKTLPIGKYIITWPWKRVKFLPILFSEFLLSFPNSSVAVIGNIKNDDYDFISFPGINEIFQHMIYLEPKFELNKDLKKEMGKFKRRDVILKKDRTFYIIKKIGANNTSKYRIEDIYDGNVEKCKKEIFDTLEEEFGDKCIRIYRKIPSKRRPRIMNENGIFDVTIGIREEWTGDLRYNKTWLWESLLNCETMNRIDSIKNTFFFTEEDFKEPYEPSGLYLISDLLDPNLLFNKLLEINPEIIIIENIDDFIRDKIYGGRQSKAFFNFIKKTSSTILMFSISPDIRHMLDIGNPKTFLKNYDIEFHTWDSSLIIDKLKSSFRDYNIHSPLYSLADELPNYGNKPLVEYISLEALEPVDNLIKEFNFDKSTEFYFSELKKSPLKIKGDYTKPNVYKRFFGSSVVQFDSIISKLFREEEKTAIQVKKIINDIYNISEDQKNPLLDEIIILLNNLLADEKNMITVVVHGMDVKGLNLILEQKDFSQYLNNYLSCASWKKLLIRERYIPEGYKHIVISTRQPSLDYQIYNTSNVNKFIFVGSEQDIKKTKLIIENRITENISRPLIYPSETAPELLKSTIGIIAPDKYDSDLFLDENTDFNLFNYISPEGNIHQKQRHIKIEKGDEAILAFDNNNDSMFLPLNKHIFFKISTKGSISEIRLKKESIDEIINKEIILDRHGVYTSFKHVFTKFMIENGDKTQIRSGVYQWDNFGDLFKDAISWIEILRQTTMKIIKEKKMDLSDANDFLSEYLAKLNLNAKNKDYIKNWWYEPEFINTNQGQVPIYEIEHPKSREDLIKIYQGINIIFNDMQLDIEDADKSYIASRTLQKMRRRFFKDEKRSLFVEQELIFSILRKEISKIINESNSFIVKSASIISLKEDIYPLEKIDGEKAINFIN